LENTKAQILSGFQSGGGSKGEKRGRKTNDNTACLKKQKPKYQQ
jgi:hypothetical protein